MEYAEGGDLQHLLDEKRGSGDHFSISELQSIMFELAQGMQAINAKLIHRDIRPSNILIKEKLKISDFGLSKVVGEATRTLTFKGIQHMAYMAPEAWTLEKNTIQMDIYSMGIVYYELATLQHPYSVSNNLNPIDAWRQAHRLQIPKPPDTLNSSIPAGLAQTIIKMIAKRPEERHSSWDEIIERIQKVDDSVIREKPDGINKLVGLARSKQHQRDIKESQIQREKELYQERQEIVQFQDNQLYDDFETIVNKYNEEYDGPKLQITKTQLTKAQRDHFAGERPFFVITGIDGDIRVVINYVQSHLKPSDVIRGKENMQFRNRPVFAWGYVIARSGIGSNLLLVPDNEEDLYGQWWILPIMHEPITVVRDNRPEPFPFTELTELSEFLLVINALGVYKTEPESFSEEFLVSLLKEIV